MASSIRLIAMSGRPARHANSARFSLVGLRSSVSVGVPVVVGVLTTGWLWIFTP